MDELLAQLQIYSYKLYRLNMRQAAADYDYFIAWMKSTQWSESNKHIGVVPAGASTIAPYANNCPIPYTVSNKLIGDCTKLDFAGIAIKQIKEILTEISAGVLGEDETTAVNAFIEYTDELIKLIYGDSPEPVVESKSAYLRSAAYQTSNKSVAANSSNYLYPAGESGFVEWDSTKTYTLTGAYRNNDAPVDITGASLAMAESSGNQRLSLIWGPTAAQVCYITYDEAE
jgi:hypothetical protein